MTEQDRVVIDQPYMVCPACEEYWCVVQQMEVQTERLDAVLPLVSRTIYHLLAACPCGANWSNML